MAKGTAELEPLTGREADVLACLGEGMSNSEIAERLFLSITTIKWYVRQLNSKLDTTNRDEIVERARAVGLLDADQPENSTAKHKLPYQTTAFIGRDAELNELARILATPDARLVTILAPGGMGKTRFALEAAEQQLYNFPNGVYFVPLQPLTEVDHIVPAVAQHVGFQFTQDDRSPKQQLFAYLGGKKMLLLLDNWEHLLEGAPLIAEILQIAPDVKVLATSREKLNLSGETVYALRGMQFPTWETPEDALQYDAVKLLVQAARRVQPDFAVTAENLDYVARVCRLTEGMPLGILLAMGWLDTVSLERIGEEIQKSVDFLETEMRDVPERQRSVRAVFESAWERLAPADQQVFMKLSVFRGGCTPEAAEALTGAKPRTLQTLVNKALLRRTKDGRFDIHELLRQYGYERLAASGTLEETLHQHSVYFAEFLRQREDDLKGRRQLAAIEEIEAELDNVHQGSYQALQSQDMELIEMSLFSLMTYAIFRSRQVEFASMFAAAARILGAKYAGHHGYGRLLAYYGRALHSCGRYEEAELALKEALAIAQAQDDLKGIAYSTRELSRTVYSLGKVDEAWPLGEESIRIYTALSDDYQLADMLRSKGTWLGMSGKNEEALAITQQAAEIQRQLGDEIGMARSLREITIYIGDAGRYDEAESLTREVLALRRRHKQPAELTWSLRDMAWYEFQKGNLVAYQKYIKESFQIAQEIGHPREVALSLLGFALIAIVSDHFDEAERNIAEAVKLAVADINPGHLLCRAFARLGLHDWTGSRTALIDFLKHTVTDLPSVLPESVLGMAFIMAEAGQVERGLELASLALNRFQMPKCSANSPLVSRHMEAIKSKLTDEAYVAAWERGKALDWKATIIELIAQSGDGMPQS